jgi:hypothetical protein
MKEYGKYLFGLAVVVAVGIYIAVQFTTAYKEPTVTVDASRISVDGDYAATIDLASITGVELLDALPAVGARTNGFAAGDVLRGHFNVGGRAAMLWVFAKDGPALKIATADTDYLLLFKDPARTRALYEQVKAALP